MSGTKGDGDVLVDAVIVPPFRDGEAFGHSPSGACIAFTGTREAMLRIGRLVRAHADGSGPPVRITLGSEFRAVRSPFCPFAHDELEQAS